MINILGINITIDSRQEILHKISSFLDSETSHYLVTPNPEFLLAARKDEEFFYILNKADMAIPDGIGLSFAALFLNKILKRISGIDLMYDICELAANKNKTIFLLGGNGDVAKKVAAALRQTYPTLAIVGAESGLAPDEWEIADGQWVKGEEKNKNVELKINKAKPDIIFVAFGHGKQEKWIHHNLPNLPSVTLAMGVGGSFDFIAGTIKRAPNILREMGLEWLWRLLQEPKKRLPRVYDAVVRFPLAFIDWHMVKPWQYRPNVACLLYTQRGGTIYVLLAERRSEIGHWQLPQGGTDGEDLETAGSRELREEIGTDKFKTVAIFKNLYRYEFGEEVGRAGLLAQKIRGYRGQKQGLLIAEFTGQDSDIAINYWDHRAWKWAALHDVVASVHPIRKKATKEFIEKFKFILKEDL